MRRSNRLKIFITYLKTIISEGGSGNFVIFTDPETNKFVQFVGEQSERLVILDVPKVALTKSETKRLKTIFGALLEETKYSYQAEVTPDQGAKCAEKLFRDVYLLPDNFNVQNELKLE